MNLIQAASKKPVLPEVSATPVHPIDILGISEVRSADRLRQRNLQRRRPRETDVVGHQAIAKYVEAEALAVEVEVRTTVVINEENIVVRLWRIVALNHAVRLTRNADPGDARHTDNLSLAGRQVNK